MARRRVLNTMKRLEIVLECDQVSTVVALLERHATGYTIIPDITGFGHHGRREHDIVLLVTVLTRDHVDDVLDALVPLLNERSGVVLVSDVGVLRGEYFVPEVRDRQLRAPKLDAPPSTSE